MSKQHLLLVDGDARSLRVLEVSLRKAGFHVTSVTSVKEALDKLEASAPDLIISETTFPADHDGFELRRRVREVAGWSSIPFIFLTAQTAIENKIRGLELGVDDYLTKPIYIKEIVTRIHILLQRRQRQVLDLRKDGTRFAGLVADIPVVDVIQTVEVSRKSGVIQFSAGPTRQATIYFRDGKVIDAEAGALQGEDAVYRLLTWNDGEFEVEFRTVRRREVIATSSQGLLMEGMRRLDEWSRLLEPLPPLSHRLELDTAELASRLGELPDDNNRILRLFDGRRTLQEVIDASDFGDLACLQAISRLYFEGLLKDLDPGSGALAAPGVVAESPRSPLHDAASGSAEADSPALATSPGEPPPGRSAGDGSVPASARVGVTMGWDAQPDPSSQPSGSVPASARVGVTMGWDAQPDPSAPSSSAGALAGNATGSAPLSHEPVASPVEMASTLSAVLPGRDAAPLTPDREVVSTDDVHAPLSGQYRLSSLRLIDEAVAAAELIEPSLLQDDATGGAGSDVLSRQGIGGTSSSAPMATSAVGAGPSSVVDSNDQERRERVKQELASVDPRASAASLANPVDGATPEPPSALAPTGRSVKKTLPPPVPRAAARPARPKDELPLLDSSLLTSGEHELPGERDLATAPLLDSSLLTSGEHVIPSERALAAPDEPPRRAALMTAATPEVIALDEVTGARSREGAAAGAAGEPATTGAAAVGVSASPAPGLAGASRADGTPDDAAGVPTVIEEVDSAAGFAREEREARAATGEVVVLARSGDARLIGTSGQDRAEAFGELRPPRSAELAPTEKMPEVVTIQPRRKAGDTTKGVVPPSAGTPTSAQAAGGKPGASGDRAAGGKPAVEAPARPRPAPPPRPSVEGGVVVERGGPSRAAVALLGLLSLFAGAAVYNYFSKTKRSREPIAVVSGDAPGPVATGPSDALDPRGASVDAGVVATAVVSVDGATASLPSDASVASLSRDASVASLPGDASVASLSRDASVASLPVDARVAPARADASVTSVATAPGDASVTSVASAPGDASVTSVASAPGDAAVAPSPAAGGTGDKVKDSRQLYERGHAALEQGDLQAALDLLDQSLKLRRTAKALLERARVLQRLSRIDEALASIDEVLASYETMAAAHEQRGMLLWSAQRYAEARPSLERFLELEPTGRKADAIRSMLDEPR